MPSQPASLAIFCKVVDNFGDIGICWRLARQWRQEHGLAVTLWVDDLASFRRICPEIVPDAETQQAAGVTVRRWAGQQGTFSPADIPDVVIEFFGCDIPPGYIAAMAQREPRPVWINLEGLSAEEWVEGCHTLPSPHPRLPLTKHFFYPGFTGKTGGLPCEAGLDEERRGFQADRAAVAAFLGRFGVTPAEMQALKVSLFCYPHAPVAALFDAWQAESTPVVCLAPAGIARDAVEAFLGAPAVAGAARTRGALTVRAMPFVPQPDYDRLLWACDVNFVRGEDSFVRAQWALKPFIWHIYPPDENLHHKKLRAFLQRYDAGGRDGLADLAAFSLHWNGAVAEQADWPSLWRAFRSALPRMEARAAEWKNQVRGHGDMAANLLAFAVSLRK